jgi:hypothetical protein
MGVLPVVAAKAHDKGGKDFSRPSKAFACGFD